VSVWQAVPRIELTQGLGPVTSRQVRIKSLLADVLEKIGASLEDIVICWDSVDWWS
jgi:hypothetical protein